jgi:hypothetical protein
MPVKAVISVNFQGKYTEELDTFIGHEKKTTPVLVVGPISTEAMKAYSTLTPIESRHSSTEALHTPSGVRDL